MRLTIAIVLLICYSVAYMLVAGGPDFIPPILDYAKFARDCKQKCGNNACPADVAQPVYRSYDWWFLGAIGTAMVAVGVLQLVDLAIKTIFGDNIVGKVLQLRKIPLFPVYAVKFVLESLGALPKYAYTIMLYIAIGTLANVHYMFFTKTDDCAGVNDDWLQWAPLLCVLLSVSPIFLTAAKGAYHHSPISAMPDWRRFPVHFPTHVAQWPLPYGRGS